MNTTARECDVATLSPIDALSLVPFSSLDSLWLVLHCTTYHDGVFLITKGNVPFQCHNQTKAKSIHRHTIQQSLLLGWWVVAQKKILRKLKWPEHISVSLILCKALIHKKNPIASLCRPFLILIDIKHFLFQKKNLKKQSPEAKLHFLL